MEPNCFAAAAFSVPGWDEAGKEESSFIENVSPAKQEVSDAGGFLWTASDRSRDAEEGWGFETRPEQTGVAFVNGIWGGSQNKEWGAGCVEKESEYGADDDEEEEGEEETARVGFIVEAAGLARVCFTQLRVWDLIVDFTEVESDDEEDFTAWRRPGLALESVDDEPDSLRRQYGLWVSREVS